MAFTARSVIDQARFRHALFDDKGIPLPVAVGLLDGYLRRLRSELFQRMPRLLASQTTVPLPLADFELGATVPAYLAVLDVTAFLTTNGLERGEMVTIVPFEQRFESGVWPACYLVRDGLYLKGDPGEWTGYTQLLVTYVPADTALTGPDVDIELPDALFMACVESLAALMGLRMAGSIPPAVLSALATQAAEAQELALTNLTSQLRYERWSVREY